MTKLIENYLPADYTDTHVRKLCGRSALMSDDLLRTMFTQFPWWVNGLLKLRSVLVAPFGLRSDGFEAHLAEMIEARSEHEVVFGMDDKHLCFHASVWCSEWADGVQTVGVTTVVTYNNALGKVYFFVIRPFHGLIIRSLLRRI